MLKVSPNAPGNFLAFVDFDGNFKKIIIYNINTLHSGLINRMSRLIINFVKV